MPKYFRDGRTSGCQVWEEYLFFHSFSLFVNSFQSGQSLVDGFATSNSRKFSYS